MLNTFEYKEVLLYFKHEILIRYTQNKTYNTISFMKLAMYQISKPQMNNLGISST